MGVGMGISDSPRQLMNQLQRATACSSTGSAAKTKRASTTSPAGPQRAADDCSAARSGLSPWLWAGPEMYSPISREAFRPLPGYRFGPRANWEAPFGGSAPLGALFREIHLPQR